jgi:hypothetical protein
MVRGVPNYERGAGGKDGGGGWGIWKMFLERAEPIFLRVYHLSSPAAAHHTSMSSSTMAFVQTCSAERKASLQCIEDNYGDTHEKSDICKKFFDDYKECTGRERMARLERNAKAHLKK